MALANGELVLGRYVVEKMIGQGGMGAVYRAHHQKLGIPVAIKTITGGDGNAELVARFGREAQLLARVRHQNVVSILDVGDTNDGSPCMVMEFLEGEGLDARLERRGALPWPDVRAIGLYVLQGLDAMHAAGIVHRDLKPGNVLAVRGTPEVIKLVDFGIAQSSASDVKKYTRTGALIGTPAYMSPEQLIGGNVEATSDLYALGLMLYELATGKLPFGDDPNGALRRLREVVPPPVARPPLPPVPEAGAHAIMQMLQVEPAHRPKNAKACYALLHGARGSGGSAQLSQAARPPSAQSMPQARPAPPQQGTAVGRGGPPAPPPTAAARSPAPPHQATDYQAQGYDVSMQPAPAPMPAVQQPAHTQLSGARVLVAARLPVSRMSREEQKALATLAAPGRAYHLGGGIWFAVVPGPSEQETKAAARRIGNALQDRFGDTCKVVFTQASANFALTPASLSGAAPLPDEINHLLEHLL
ncbi:MAG TPA: serine/threonine-protein kinase [Polyangiales bacterium]|jgi:serine/threonine-protein kinase|nr:serine/threonine-protein kinase [Polyangiales bacterium]